jgi:electron transfer flavoprotein beta subunit
LHGIVLVKDRFGLRILSTKSVSLFGDRHYVLLHLLKLYIFDALAVEEAIRLKEKTKTVSSIIALSIGPSKNVETLRTALAMGADSAIHIVTPELPAPSANPEPISVAAAIKAVVERSKGSGDKAIDLIIMGKQAIDDDSGSTGGMLAGMLGWGQGTFASKLTVDKASGKVEVTREIDGGLAKFEGKLPMIVTTDLR